MTKCGFYRRCLAKEVGYSEEAALRLAEHASAGNFGIIQIHYGSQSNVVQPAPTKKVSYSRKAKRKT